MLACPDEGLEENLLSLVLSYERRDLEEDRNALIADGAAMVKELSELQERVLVLLSNAQGNVLDDDHLISTLSESKLKASEVERKHVIAATKETEINDVRELYRPLARLSAAVYFAVANLADVERMYIWSMEWFEGRFTEGCKAASDAREIGSRLSALREAIMLAVYSSVCRSLFERHKLLFALALAGHAAEIERRLEVEEWRFLLSGGDVHITEDSFKKSKAAPTTPSPSGPGHDWLSPQSWQEVCKLAKLPSFSRLPSEICAEPEKWRTWHDHPEPHTMPPPYKGSPRTVDPDALGRAEAIAPGGEDESGGAAASPTRRCWPLPSMSALQRLLLVRCLRPDKCVPAVSTFVADVLGVAFTVPPPFDLAESFKESIAALPILFILSPGIDPAAALLKFAVSKGVDGTLRTLSLGQGQGSHAEQMVNAALADKGCWVQLQNCHLAPSWMQDLERICEELASREKLPPGFRLWLTAAPCDDFPVTVLRRGVKVTNEAPRGLRSNLLSSYLTAAEAGVEAVSGVRSGEFRTLFFSLCFYHAVVSERRRFGPRGWSHFYEFNASDLTISAQQLQHFLGAHPDRSAGAATGHAAAPIPFEGLRYLTGELNYGGRITDAVDRRLCGCLLEELYSARALSPRKPFAFSPSEAYGPPPANATLAETRQHIMALPHVDPVEILGLDENASIARANREARELFASALALQPTKVAVAAASRDETAALIADEMAAQMPQPFDLGAARTRYPATHHESVNVVLLHELTRYNALLLLISASLDELSQALAGCIPMTDDLEGVATALHASRLPMAWARAAYPSCKPLASWVSDLLHRFEFFGAWLAKGEPQEFWLPAFFKPHAFMTSLLLNHARRFSQPIERLRLEHRILTRYQKGGRSRPETGAHVYGLFLEGAAWSSKRHALTEAPPKQLVSEMNVIWLLPSDGNSPLPTDAGGEMYSCPLYSTAERNVLVDHVILASESPRSLWIKRGVALLCSLE